MMKGHYIHWCLLIIIVNGTYAGAQICGTAGSIEHAGMIAQADSTYLLLNYTIPCNGVVYRWEFCYFAISDNNVTFYPSIWRPSNANRHTLINVNRVTLSVMQDAGFRRCVNYTITDDEQFSVLTGDIVGLYSDASSQLAANRNDSVISYVYRNSNQSGTVDHVGRTTSDEIIAIKVYITIRGSVITSTVVVPTVMASTTSIDGMNRTSTVTRTTHQAHTTNGGSSTIGVTTSTYGLSSTVLSVSTNGFNGDSNSTVVNEPSSTFSFGATNTHGVNSTSTVVMYTPSSNGDSSTAVVNEPSSIFSRSTGTDGINNTVVIRNTLNTNGNNSTTIIDKPTNSANREGFSIPYAGAIIGGALGVIIFIAITIVILVVIVVKRKRKAKNYRINQTSKAANTTVAYCHRKPEPVHDKSDGINAYEITTIKFSSNSTSASSPQSYLIPRPSAIANDAQPYTSPKATGCVQPYVLSSVIGSTHRNVSSSAMEYEVPNPVDKIYADPGNKKDVIFNWFEKNQISKINSNDIKVCRKIGSGHFGVVSLGLWSNGSANPVQVAVKTLNSQCSESDRVKFLREAAIMGQFVHNNVVQLHGVVTKEENMMIVLEYMPKGDLKKFLRSNKEKFSSDKLPEMLLSFCRQIAAGMNYLANKQFVHRDLAARNVLLSNDNVCKIADFGMSRDVIDNSFYTASGGKVPVKWTALEAVLYNKYSVMSDVWSFGCVMYEVWSLGHSPFENVQIKEYVLRIMNGQRLPPPPGCSRALYELMMQCWHPEAMERPKPMMLLNKLCKLDVTQLRIYSEDEELTKLGDPLTTSEQLYSDLQGLYIIND